MRNKQITDEENTAKSIIKLLSNIHLDLTMIGYYFANLATRGDFMRLDEVHSSAQETVDTANDKNRHYSQMITLGKD